ncbi:EpsG family protein, partial [Pseudothermotoga sp.]|uniref:EpsG family protein n=1 Tax=Pseudothermotoga sp. TaxID=2033661 RepID=UPI0031F6F7EE
MWKSLTFVMLLIFIGLRHEVGGDWFAYLRWYQNVESRGLSFSLESFILSDWGYNFLNWLVSKLRLGIYGVNTACAFIFLLGLFSFLDYLGSDRDFYLGLLISYPYLIMVVANGYTRQSVAIGL